MSNRAYHSRALRRGRWSMCGQPYIVKFATRQRQPLFLNFLCARIVAQAMGKARCAETLAFVVMPDHVHWLFWLLEGGDLSRVIQIVKSSSAQRINHTLHRKGSIWQDGFHDRAVRRQEKLKNIARYIVANPIRAGLTTSVRTYPHWFATWV